MFKHKPNIVETNVSSLRVWGTRTAEGGQQGQQAGADKLVSPQNFFTFQHLHSVTLLH